MSGSQIAAALAFAAICGAAPAGACAVHEPLNLAAVRNADVVVIGRVSGDRSRGRVSTAFTVTVDDVLAGRAAHVLSVGLEPGLGGPPMSALRGRVLLALRRSAGPGLTVIQHMCSDPFILDAASPAAGRVRALLARSR